MSLDRPPITEDFRDAVEHNAARTRNAKSTPPFSLRLTAAEKAELLRRAGNMPLGAYIRSQLLTKDEQSPPAHVQTASKGRTSPCPPTRRVGQGKAVQ